MIPDRNEEPDAGEGRPVVGKVILVGHCGFDQGSISRAVTSALRGVVVEMVYDTAGLDRHAGPEALLLVNRVLDGRFSTGSGVDLIAELSGRDAPPLMMLISNYPDAQAKAVEAGALPGFGKNALGLPETAQKLQAAVASARA